MINSRIIARVFSQVLILEGILMLVSSGVSWIYNEPAARSFLFSAVITLVTGILVFTPLRHQEKVYGTREGFIIITFIWILFGAFGSLPYLFTSSTGNFTDAFFESISGFTTTGATIFRDIESLPRGLLFWRSLTQWIGGITVITLALHVLPVVRSLNIQLPATEFPGITADKIHPRVIETTKRLIGVYVALTIAEIILLALGKMPFFDSVCHSFSTLSTGGFSTRNTGIATFPSLYIKAVFILFMFFAGINPALFYFAFKRSFTKIIRNNEFAAYLVLAILFPALIIFLLFREKGISFSSGFMDGLFNTISVITTTGFYTVSFNEWGYLAMLIIFFLMFTGGMAGSASGGIKVVRLLIAARNSRNESRRMIHPNAYLPVRVDQKKVPQNIIQNLLIFIIIYFITLCTGALLISFLDYDIITSFSTAASMLANIGPGLGTFAPFSTYADLPLAGKWILSGLMILGRVEILSVLILFTGSFYNK
ncbi:MAG: TrkH family potassium uptake protein [Bacteroidales bacterium]|nr:TrkH family potassium uptake protein [Bacteroidales bacterium]